MPSLGSVPTGQDEVRIRQLWPQVALGNVLAHLRPAPPKKEGADVRYGSKPDIERSEQDNAKPRYNGDECDGNNG